MDQDDKSVQSNKSRRDFIFVATAAVGSAGVGALAWPMIGSMRPAADVVIPAHYTVDISKIEPGQEIRVLINAQPIFIRHRTPADIKAAQDVDLKELRDPQSDQDRLVPMEDGRYRPEILVINGKCPHFGCVTVGGNSGNFSGWYCPCHGAHFDTSGRVRKGPPSTNMAVPEYKYKSDNLIEFSYYPRKF